MLVCVWYDFGHVWSVWNVKNFHVFSIVAENRIMH